MSYGAKYAVATHPKAAGYKGQLVRIAMVAISHAHAERHCFTTVIVPFELTEVLE
jgi:hypothetical protein